MIARLAWRSIWRHRRRTLITLVSIALGLAINLFFISLAEGVYAKMTDDAVRQYAGHITLEHPLYREAPAVDLFITIPPDLRYRVLDFPDRVERTKLLIQGQGVARTGRNAVGVAILGVEPDVEKLASPLADRISRGSYLEEGDGPLVVVGSALADQLKLDVGKKLVLSSNDAQGNLVEELCRVKGIFNTGTDELDSYLVQAPIEFTRKLYGLPDGSATQMGLILEDPRDQRRVLSAVREIFQQGGEGLPSSKEVAALPWQEILPDLAAYIQLDGLSNKVFQGLLLAIILFTIFNTLLMSVLERRREFAVLMALGTPPGQIRRQVLLESIYIGLIGCLAGGGLGGLIGYYFQQHGLDMSSLMEDGYNISGFAVDAKLHAMITPGMLLTGIGIVFGATVLLSLIPMRRSTQVSLSDVLR